METPSPEEMLRKIREKKKADEQWGIVCIVVFLILLALLGAACYTALGSVIQFIGGTA